MYEFKRAISLLSRNLGDQLDKKWNGVKHQYVQYISMIHYIMYLIEKRYKR